MKIAIIASNNGEKAMYLHDFFKEGNRIDIDCLLTENPDSPIAQKLREEGIEIITVSPEDMGFGELLKGRDIEIIVVDDFSGEIPADIREAFGEAIVFPTSSSSAPLEVITTSDRLKAAATAAANPAATVEEQPKSESPDATDNTDDLPEFEKEWAEALEIDVESPKTEGNDNQPSEPQPPVFDSQQPPTPQYPNNPTPQYPNNPTPQYPNNPLPQYPNNPTPQYSNNPTPQYPNNPTPQYSNIPPEPMPNTYLVWSVIITILCCLIPGIVAIIYSASVSSKYYAGDIEGSKRASRNAQIWCIVAVVAGILWATLYIPLMLFVS